ncbi:acetylxylan esterase [Microlunatus panaciterrae]|uniref:4-O-methyl-glucuronoyl methylesterase-like domain-containing protein n=1 Tax=Microlunatus panaciterrae TaxID=400768 RepID=A0ABS2RJA8_9ACTN|nr:acetylxylan esterase [Microlunatus panaciterrae]MBM7799085.1 hypothetical protein [Microlunatus panaciterrae]
MAPDEPMAPAALRCLDGSTISTAEEWLARRRPELLELFAEYVYGHTPDLSLEAVARTHREDIVLGGRAVRREVDVVITGPAGERTVQLLLYLPTGAKCAVPVFVGLNFSGNHTVDPDPRIRPARAEQYPPGGQPTVDPATAGGRGSLAHRWPIDMIIDSGFGAATAFCGDVEPDHPEGAAHGVRGLLADFSQHRSGSDWGTLGVWAWALSRLLEVLSDQPGVDPDRILAVGHSRLGKAALWAAAQDERFALVVSNESGCGGASPSRRPFGESVHDITSRFPHWFCPRFAEFAGREDDLPVDQHLLLAAIAPRLVYVASAREDLWSDPEGERLSALAAAPVFDLFGADRPAGEPAIGYHLREGEHDILPEDWQHYLRFAADRLG